MKKILFTLAAAAVFVSCKKEQVTAPAPAPVPVNAKKLVKETNTDNAGNTEVTTYTYDASGRVTREERGNNAWNYSYPTKSSIIRTNVNTTTGKTLTVANYTLNTAGRVTHMEMVNELGVVSATQDFSYTADGYIARHASSSSGNTYVYDYTYANGICTQGTRTLNGAANESYQFQVDNAKSVKVNLSAGGFVDYALFSFFGTEQAFPVKDMQTFDKVGNPKRHLTYSHEINANGYITKRIYKDLTSGYESVSVYEYQ